MNLHEKITLMLVDDDSDDIYFFLKAVKKIPGFYECITAKHGEDALHQLEEANALPDYIFLDLNMPRMNGKNCIIALKNNNRLKHIPVIIYSTSAAHSDINTMLALGAVYYLPKPMEIAMLPGMISEALQNAQTSGMQEQKQNSL